MDVGVGIERLNGKAKKLSTLEQDFNWLSNYLKVAFEGGNQQEQIALLKAVRQSKMDNSHYSRIVGSLSLNPVERLALILTLAANLNPSLLDPFIKDQQSPFFSSSAFGGRRNDSHRGFLPTGQTLVALLPGNVDTNVRQVFKLLQPQKALMKAGLLQLEENQQGNPLLSGRLQIPADTLEQLVLGESTLPRYSSSFPAQLLSSKLEWGDLVLEPKTHQALAQVDAWLTHHDTLMNEWGFGNKLGPGYHVLFYGQPGTGKSMAAALLGKKHRMPVFRIDISKMVSKYIGETEKNLARVFDRAEQKNWILFFDEADALFGKRTATKDSKDRHANQEIAYLLQRIESFDGMVILATNLKENIDPAFARRFKAMVQFAIPGPADRLKLWTKAMPTAVQLNQDLNLQDIARKYELSGGPIHNAMAHACLLCLQRGDQSLRESDLLEGIQQELQKTGRSI